MMFETCARWTAMLQTWGPRDAGFVKKTCYRMPCFSTHSVARGFWHIYLFSNKILGDKMHIGWKLHYFCIYSYKQHCHIGNVSRDIGGSLINPQLKCFEIFLIFHGLLLWLLKKIVIKIFVNRSQESLEKNSWVPIAMLRPGPVPKKILSWLRSLARCFFRPIVWHGKKHVYSLLESVGDPS
jgi:hypothetical protein